MGSVRSPFPMRVTYGLVRRSLRRDLRTIKRVLKDGAGQA
jgi:hypothetical protein